MVIRSVIVAASLSIAWVNLRGETVAVNGDSITGAGLRFRDDITEGFAGVAGASFGPPNRSLEALW